MSDVSTKPGRRRSEASNSIPPVGKDVPPGVARRDLVAALFGIVGAGAAASAISACVAEVGPAREGEPVGQASAATSGGIIWAQNVGLLGGGTSSLRGCVGSAAYGVAVLEGFDGPGDGGGGVFYWVAVDGDAGDAGASLHNGGTIISACANPGDPVAGYWYRIYSGAVNVQWFGAGHGDAGADWTAITSALGVLTGSGTGGGVLYFPRGNYLLTSTLTISAAGVVLQGDGRTNTSITVPASGTGISVTGNDAVIRDLDIVAAPSAGSTQVSLVIDGAADFIVERVRFLSAYTSLSLAPTSAATAGILHDVAVFCNVPGASSSSLATGILIQNIEGLRASAVDVKVLPVPSTTEGGSATAMTNFVGINILGTALGQPDTVSFVDSGVGDQTGLSSSWTALQIAATSGSNFGEWLKFTHCTFESPVVNTQPTVAITAGMSVVFTNCYMKGGVNGVYIAGGSSLANLAGVRLVGCVVVATNHEGIYHSGVAPTSIVACTVANASQAASNGYAGIKLSSTSQYASIIGGSSGNVFPSVSAYQQCGVVATSGATSFFIEGIDCSSNLSAPTSGTIGPTISVSGTHQTISPTCQVQHVSGSATISHITPPAFQGPVVLIPDTAWSTEAYNAPGVTGGNIAVGTTAVVSKALTMTWDSATLLWYPSYT